MILFTMSPKTMTFQPKAGFRKLLEKKAVADDRSVAYVINKYIEAGLIRDGLIIEGQPLDTTDDSPDSES